MPPPPERALSRPLLRLACALAALLVLTPVAASAMVVDPYAPYQPQTTCSPNPKAGTLALSTWLQKQYPGSGSLGISRSCKDGGVSEHKEGRAFDWAVSVHSARDRGYVASFFKRAFATDADGNKHALARRMGIMYMIWDDHIYSSYYAFSRRLYHGCATLRGCSDTLRHRNHVHISLSRDGGAGRTSWYSGGETVPAPSPTPPPPSVLDLSSTPYARVRVPANGKPQVTPFALAAGTTYTITASGLYGYGVPTQVADASCRWSTSEKTWLPYPSPTVAASHGSLNLRVAGTRISDATCHPDTHVYSRTITPSRTGPVTLDIANVAQAARGAIRVLVSKPGTDVSAGLRSYPALAPAPATSAPLSGPALLGETVGVPASAITARTVGSLTHGVHYRLTVSGTAALGRGVLTDGRCVLVRGAWYRQAALALRFPGAQHGRLFVDGAPFTGRAAAGSTCGSRTHSLDYTATRTGRLELALWDPLSRADDTGALTVRVRRLDPLPER